jgi:Ca2+-binding EF-hand superfamily protein
MDRSTNQTSGGRVMTNMRKKLKYDGSEDIDLGLLISVCSQIQEDVQNKDYTAIENLFQYLDDPEDRLKGFLRDD